MSAIQNSQDLKSSSEVHSPIIEGVKFKGTPAYDLALKRLITLGLSLEEAQGLLKD